MLMDAGFTGGCMLRWNRDVTWCWRISRGKASNAEGVSELGRVRGYIFGDLTTREYVTELRREPSSAKGISAQGSSKGYMFGE